MSRGFAAFCQRHRRFRRLTDFIGASLDTEDLCLADLADIACLSPAQLMRLYRRRTGEGPMQAVRRLRLLRARDQLLQEPAAPITRIAFDSGYDSNAAFTHAFRRQFGLSPSELRQQPPRPAEIAPLRLIHLPERKVWQFRYSGAYGDNSHYKARLAWLCLNAGSRQWRGWRLNDLDHPFCEEAERRVSLCHFVPAAQQPLVIPEADLVTQPGGLYVVTEINPTDRERCMATLDERVREQFRARLAEGPSIEQDLHIRDFRPPQDRRIALYLPVTLPGRPAR